MYSQSMFRTNIRKNIKIFPVEINIFTAVNYCCILHGHVYIILVTEMCYHTINVANNKGAD